MSGQPKESNTEIVARLIIGTITNTEFLKRLKPMWDPSLVGSGWRWIAAQSFQWLEDKGEAIGRNIELRWATCTTDEDTRNDLEGLLERLDTEFEEDTEKFDTDELVKQAARYFTKQYSIKHGLLFWEAVEADRMDEAEKLLEEMPEKFKAFSNACGATLSGVTARELQEMDLPEPEWLVNGVVPVGLTLLAGKPKSGKSYLTINMAASLALGSKVFNMIETEPAEILYLGLEDPKWRIKKRMGEVLGDDEQEWPEGLTFFASGEWPKMNAGGMDRFERWMREHPATRLIIVDTLHKIRPPSRAKGNTYSEDYTQLEKLQEFAARYNISIIVVHHTKRAREKDVFDEILGGHGLTGATDTNMVFCKVPGPNQNLRQLHYQGRETGEGMLELSFENQRFFLDDLSPGIGEEAPKDKKLSPDRMLILGILENYPRCSVQKSDLLAEYARVKKCEPEEADKKKGFSMLLTKMVDSNQVVRLNRGVYAHPQHLDHIRATELCRNAWKIRMAMNG